MNDALLVTSVVVDAGPGHDRVRVWNRHGLAGELVVSAGDGAAIADRLRMRIDPALVDAVRKESPIDALIPHARPSLDQARAAWQALWRDGEDSNNAEGIPNMEIVNNFLASVSDKLALADAVLAQLAPRTPR